ncbi:MAG: methionine sulfoxide reductase heme-binding subunit [Chloroflexota bacterium]|jgi:predicted ferric reductase|nr:methionine sulfoxide reductase heme-binding subunit [Chloroflexota bacterium]
MIEALPWYVTRAAGMVSLVLLTAVVCLGLLTAARWQRPGWPRFLTAEVHRSIALLSVVFLVVHVVVAVVDPYTALGWASALVPFSSPYRQVWLGLGGVSMYLVAAMIVTSLLRGRIGRRTWRAIHLTAYASWPLAVVHGLGTGTDSAAAWSWVVNAACAMAVGGALVLRLRAHQEERAAVETALPMTSGSGFR